MKSISEQPRTDLNRLRNEMMAELRRLQNLLGGCNNRQQPGSARIMKNSIPRNYNELTGILKVLGIFVDVKKKIAIISKDNGDFFINLMDGTVKFSPIICIKCVTKCPNPQRKLCIIGDSNGWANFQFSEMDLLILSKVFAIYYNMLPNHVLAQIKKKSHCFNQTSIDDSVIEELCSIPVRNPLDNTHLIHAPPIQGPNQPPQLPEMNLRFNNPSQQPENLKHPPNLVHLKKLMHKELKRLQNHLEFSKSIHSSPKL